MGIIYVNHSPANLVTVGLTHSYNDLVRMDGTTWAWAEVSKHDGPRFLEIAKEALDLDEDGYDHGVYACTVIILRTGLFPHEVEKRKVRTAPVPKNDPEQCKDKILEFVPMGREWITRGRLINRMKRWDRKVVEKALSVLVREKALEMKMEDHPTNGSTTFLLRMGRGCV